ncbi:S1 family peptidase [Streptomyces sp. TG1A-8]|uniref:S1 family peptidase n=1 Tax=Streptomyces sp. TG1A-8 TaxID=3051385 RepID=UPI00265B8771|nr:S1 family peptidase [Streptomyces sp. TG1A-8]MDO0924520.1 S1 family peptidase [Streptomyces sp. TG1A-8]
MSHKRMPRRKAALAAGGVAALGAAALLLPHANASQDGVAGATVTARTLRAADASDLAARLRRTLGDTLAGSYYDGGGRRLVVNVAGADEDTVARVRRTGAVVRRVDNSAAELRSAARTLRTRATMAGTAWAVDPRTDRLVVTADSTVTGARWDRLRSTVRGLGPGTATLKKSAGTFKTLASGGDAVFSRVQGGTVRCSLGFNVTAADGGPAFLTAGHCGVAAKEWSDSQAGQPVATVDRATFPGGGDFSLVKYDDPATRAPGEVDTGDGRTVPITRAEDATVGGSVFRMGSTTGLHDGQVTGLDATVNFQSETDPGGVDTVTGLIRTDVCAEPGDSGGPLFTADGGAVGLTSGGSGDCTSGGETFFQPVTTALRATGATLGAGAGDTAGADDPTGARDDRAGAGDDRAGGDPYGTGAVGGSSLTGTR